MNKRDMRVPLLIKKKQKKKHKNLFYLADRETGGKGRIFIFFIFFLSLLSSIYGNRTVRIRRGKKQSALLNEGYA